MPESGKSPGWLTTVLVIALTTVLVAGAVYLLQLGGGGADGAAGASSDLSPVEVSGGARGPAPEVGQAAPDFTAVDTEGREVSLADLRGQPVWLVFGATWCANCRAEMPDVAAVASQVSGQAEVVAVYVGEPSSTVADYAERLGLDFPQLADSTTEMSASYRVMGVPTHVFLDADGVVTSIDVGPLNQSQALDRLSWP
ncbi:MAG: TlpA family protein disulfide reductase [Bifidobacteriaceae bacterium]|jgi:peroxiredoxin|nr:TlpA family protein disulfide reductase [Bifidobacteriaceae bacterium]